MRHTAPTIGNVINYNCRLFVAAQCKYAHVDLHFSSGKIGADSRVVIIVVAGH